MIIMSVCAVCSVLSDFCDPVDYSPPGSSVHGISQAIKLEWVAISLLRDIPDPGIEPMSPMSPALQADSLLVEPTGKTIYMYLRISSV